MTLQIQYNSLLLYFSFFSSSQEQVAPLRPPDHLWRPVRHRCSAEFLTHRLHPASQWELRPTTDLTGAHSQRYLQVHGHLHHGVCGLHDRHVQPVLILSGSQVQSCLHHVSYAQLRECFGKCVWQLEGRYVSIYVHFYMYIFFTLYQTCTLQGKHSGTPSWPYSDRFMSELSAKTNNSRKKYLIWVPCYYNC